MWGAMLLGGHQTKAEGTLTIGVSGIHKGFCASVSCGAISPDTIDGHTLVEVDDASGQAVFRLSGFASDPGTGHLVSIKVGSVTLFGVDATYSFIVPNDGQWVWAGAFGLASSGATNFTLITT